MFDIVTAPVAPETLMPVPAILEVTPVLVTLPAVYARPVEKVVVAAHVGTPFRYASTDPPVPAVVVASAPLPFPYGTAPAATAAHPVPPFGTGRMPVTSLVRLMRAVETTPLAAFKKPESEVARVVTPVTFKVPPTDTLPAVSIVVDAVPPTFA